MLLYGVGLFRPAGLADQLYEPAGTNVRSLKRIAASADLNEHLLLDVADGKDGDAIVLQLREEKVGGQFGSASRDENAFERGRLGPADAAVAVTEMDVSDAERHQSIEGFIEQWLDALHGIDDAGEVGEDGGLVAAAGADLEDALACLHVEALCHQRNHIGLADGLAVADGGCAVGVGLSAGVGGEEKLAGDAADGRKYAWIVDAAFDKLLLDHSLLRG